MNILNFELVSLKLVQHRKLIFILALCAIAAAGIGIRKITFDPSMRAFFSNDREAVIQFDEIGERYVNNDSIILYVDFGKIFITDRASLSLLNKLTKDAEMLPYSYRASSLTNYLVFESEDDELTSHFAFPNDSISNAALKNLSDLASTDRAVRNRLINEKGDTATIHITFNLPVAERLQALQEISTQVKELKKRYETLEELTIYPGGSVFVENTMLHSMRTDGTHILPFALLLAIVVNLFFLRSTGALVVSLLMIVLSVMVTAGIVGHLEMKLTPSASLGFLLVLILATADSVHVSFNYLKYVRDGINQTEALAKSMALNLRPMCVTAVTTIVGVITLNLSDAPTFAMMGNICAIGVVIALLCTILVFPTLILVFKEHAKSKSLPGVHFSFLSIKFTLRFYKQILIFFALITTIASYFLFQNNFNEDPGLYFDKSTDIRATFDFSKQKVAGTERLFVDLKTKENGIHDLNYTKDARALVTYLRSRNDVQYVFSYVDVIQKITKEMEGTGTAADTLPKTRELASQYTLLYELSLPYGSDLSSLYTHKKDGILIEIGLIDKNNAELLETRKQIVDWLAKNTSLTGVSVSSFDLIFADYGQSTLNSVVLADFATVFIIMLLMMLGLGSLRYGAISLVPNIFPAILIYGLWGVFGCDITIAAAISFSVVLGIVVDDTTYLLSKYVSKRQAGVNVDQALEYAFSSSGPALITTTLILAGGSALLMLSDFTPNATVGYVMTPTVLFAICFDYLALPALLKVLDGFKHKNLSSITETAVQ